MNAKVKITAVDKTGNAVCAGMDAVLEMDGTDEANILAGAAADWDCYWYDDERVQRGEITAQCEIVETW